jgi:hypothetical protein
MLPRVRAARPNTAPAASRDRHDPPRKRTIAAVARKTPRAVFSNSPSWKIDGPNIASDAAARFPASAPCRRVASRATSQQVATPIAICSKRTSSRSRPTRQYTAPRKYGYSGSM